MLTTGDRAPSFELPAADTVADTAADTGGDSGDRIRDPWTGGPTIVAFFKVTCPTCKLVAPKVQALADLGGRVVAIGQDPPAALKAYAAEFGQAVPTASDSAPYEVSDAYGVRHVPTLFLVDSDGTVLDSVASWDRDGWNRLAQAAGLDAVSAPDDGFPSFRPG